MEKEQVLDVSWLTIAKIFLAIFIFYFIYLTKEIVLWFFFALAISVLLEPAISFLKRLWVPRILSVLFVYFSIFGILGILIYLISPVFISELRHLVQNFPVYFVKISPALQQMGIDLAQNFDTSAEFLINWLSKSSNGVIGAIMALFGGLASTAFILTAAFFLSLEENALERVLKAISPKRYEKNITTIFEKAQRKVAGWFGARVLACIFVGVASFIVFYIFGIKYALILALISGFLNFIPYIGPWLTAVLLAVFVAVSASSWFVVAYTLIAFIIIQQIEGALLTPLLMKKLVDVPPALVLLSLLVGAKLFGFLGTIFAVPVLGIIFEFIKEFLEKRKEESYSN